MKAKWEASPTGRQVRRDACTTRERRRRRRSIPTFVLEATKHVEADARRRSV